MKAICKVITAILLLSASVLGQQPTSNKPSRVSLIESSAVFWAGTAFDHLSSRGRIEGNPFLRTANGHLNVSRYYSLNGALFGLTVIFQRKYPRAMNWTRRFFGGVHFVISLNNFHQPKGVLR